MSDQLEFGVVWKYGGGRSRFELPEGAVQLGGSVLESAWEHIGEGRVVYEYDGERLLPRVLNPGAIQMLVPASEVSLDG